MNLLHSSTQANALGTPTMSARPRFFARRSEGLLRRSSLRTGLLATVACLSLAVGCGSKGSSEGEGASASSGGDEGDGEKSVSVKSGGTAPTAAVSKQAEADWKEALASFEANEKGGWDQAKCESVSGQFADANKSQKGKFAEAIYMSGLALDRCGKNDAALKLYNQAIEING
ncbi:MAG: Domain containing protein, partial [Myxococcaceae bacterium]|nr:Domain containing protein [Myxococcaceae bacterium]